MALSPTSPSLMRFRRLNVGLNVDVVVDDNLPFATTFCHDLQKTCAKSAFRVEVKTRRRAALKPRNPFQGLADGNVSCDEPQRHDLGLQRRATEWSLENELVPVTEGLPPGKKHSHDVGEGPISSEVLGIPIGVALVPGADLVIEDFADGILVRLRLSSCDYSGQQHDADCYCFHTGSSPKEYGKVYT